MKHFLCIIFIVSYALAWAGDKPGSFFDTRKGEYEIWEEFCEQLDLMVAQGKITREEAERMKLKFSQNGIVNTSSMESWPYTDEYAGCECLHDEALKAKLKEITGQGYESIYYSTARKIVFQCVDNHRYMIEDLYTNRHLEVHYSMPDSNDWNIEHIWPQSQGASNEAKSDMHHLFPCDSYANNVRANLPFGFVSGSNIWWSSMGSKCDKTVFEPRSKVKGDVARAKFYFSVRYSAPIDEQQETILKVWHEQDPPDANEVLRTYRIKRFQNNTNPFVIHPELVGQISDF